MKRFIFLFMIGLLVQANAQHAPTDYVPDPDPMIQDKVEQWRDIKFGLLMHWGIYAQWGIVESWSLCSEDVGWTERKKGSNPDNYEAYKKEYNDLITQFNPVKFDPSKWAKAARDAGMRYVIFTTKHHDGFCMFDTKQTDFKITSKRSPFSKHPKANVAKEIFDAFRKEGLWAGAYFSKPDWNTEYYWWPYFATPDRNVNYDPGKYPERWQKFKDFTYNQIEELMTGYGKMDILWLDGAWVQPREESADSRFRRRVYNQDIDMERIATMARSYQRDVLIVDRWVTGKYENYLTPENKVPEQALDPPWESCIIAGGGWGWVPNPKFKSGHDLVHLLVDVVCKGGNLLLNIGPAPDGTWPEDAYDRLAKMGAWMKVNSEAIYGTRAIKPYKEAKICYTNKKNSDTVYAIYLADEDEKEMPPEIMLYSFVPEEGSTVSLLGADTGVTWKKSGTATLIRIPESVQKNPPCDHAWTFKLDTVVR